MEGQDLDQSEDATQHKLDEARNKGSVAKSIDVVSLGVLAALCVTVYAAGWNGLRDTVLLQRRILGQVRTGEWAVDGTAHWLGELLVATLALLGPLFMAVVVVAVLINLSQTGPVFTLQPLAPDLNRLNPAAGLKRIFSMRTVFESIKSLVKLAVLGTVMYFAVSDLVPGLVGLPMAPPQSFLRIVLDLSGALLAKLVFAMLAVGMLDLMFTRWEYAKRMRMSKREVKDESKNRDGDPRIRARIRELRKEMLKRSQTLSQVRSADVLITNPTHIAVALSYKHGAGGAPQVVAKGAGEMAAAMRKLAGKHAIPVVQNKVLARTLYREVDYSGYVPEKLYPQVAKIMVWVYAMRQAKRQESR